MAALLLVLFGLTTSVQAAERKNKPAPPAFAIIAGSIFRTPGFALPRAEVTVVPKSAEAGGVKLKKLQTVSNNRGEWAVRVPAVPMEYTIYVKCSGYEPQQATAGIEGEQRRELNFILEPRKGSPGEGK